MAKYNFKEKLNHFWAMAKKGSKKSTGKELSDFERGVNAGRAKQMSQSAYSYYKKNPDKFTPDMKAKQDSIWAKQKAQRDSYFESKGIEPVKKTKGAKK